MLMDETGEEYLENFWIWLMKTNPYFGYIDIDIEHEIITVPAYKHRPIKFRVKRVGTDHDMKQNEDWVLQSTSSSTDEVGSLIESLTVNDVDAIAISDKLDANVAFSRDIKKPDIVDMNTNTIEPIWALDPTLKPGNEIKNGYTFVTLFIRENIFSYKDKRGHRKTKIQGFSPERKFYIPDYSDASLPDEQDFRRTLYWNPNVVTNNEGEATVRRHALTPHAEGELTFMTLASLSCMGQMNYIMYTQPETVRVESLQAEETVVERDTENPVPPSAVTDEASSSGTPTDPPVTTPTESTTRPPQRQNGCHSALNSPSLLLIPLGAMLIASRRKRKD